jgi:hypothetical protein
MDEVYIETLWGERRGGSVRTSSYGSGTFILGPDRALDWTVGTGKEEDASEAATALAQAPPDDLDARIREVLERRAQEAREQSAASSSGFSDTSGITPDEWWTKATTDDRIRWLAAYYAEFGDALTLLRAKPRPCRTCEAAGFIEQIDERNEIQINTCPVCKGLKYERLVNYR